MTTTEVVKDAIATKVLIRAESRRAEHGVNLVVLKPQSALKQRSSESNSSSKFRRPLTRVHGLVAIYGDAVAGLAIEQIDGLCCGNWRKEVAGWA
jgi:hypothetical protein